MENSLEILLRREVGSLPYKFYALKKTDNNLYKKVKTPLFANKSLMECEEKHDLLFYYIFYELSDKVKKIYKNSIYDIDMRDEGLFEIRNKNEQNNMVKYKNNLN